MKPTAAGERLLVTADRVLADLACAEQDLVELGSGERGVIRITTECYTCYHWVPPLLAAFGEEFPGVDLQLAPEATRRSLDALLDAEVDLAILHTPHERDALSKEKLFRDELLAVVAPDHPFAHRKELSAIDFADQHLVLHHDYEQSTLAKEFLNPAGVRPARISELQLTEAVVEVVKAGLGIGVLAGWAVRSDLAAGSLASARLSRAGLFRTWYAATRSQQVDRPALRRLVELLREHSF